MHGIELANAYTELNDPRLQEELFSKQLAGLPAEESMAKKDDDFVRALKHGMPPAGGLGVGIDRLCMILLNRLDHSRCDSVSALAPERAWSLPSDLPSTEGEPEVYKYLLCWRYLKTRYIALASVISVMLGVATMIVVNSVMAGFAEKMRDRLHGVLADVVVESLSLDGFYNSDEVMARINEIAGAQVQALAPTMETPGILHFRYPNGQVSTRPVQIIGIRPEDRANTGDFAEFLFDNHNKKIAPSFKVTDELKLNSPRGSVVKEIAGDDLFDDEIKRKMKEQVLDEIPNEGTIIGYALATFHFGKGKADLFLAPPGARSACFSHGPERPRPKAALIRSRSSVTSRAG